MTRCLDGGTLLISKRPARGLAVLLLGVVSLLVVACGGIEDSNWPGLTASGDVVYAAYGSQVLALDIVEQELLWSFPCEEQPGQTFYAAPSVVENDVVVGDYGTRGGVFSPGIKVSVFGLEQDDTKCPSVVWTSAESLIKDRIIAPPLQIGNQVFVGTADNIIYALDADNNGSVLWEYETGHSIWGQPNYEDGILYASSLDKSVYALDANGGDLLWQSPTGGSISDQAKLNTDLVYVSSFDAMIHAVEKSTGDVRWTADAEAGVWGAPAFADGRVFYADLDGNVFAVDGQTGSDLWSEGFDSYVVAAPVVKDGVVFVATAGLLSLDKTERKGSLIAFDAVSGDIVWQETIDAPLFSTPVFVQDSIVVAYDDGNVMTLVVFDTLEGDKLWTFQPSTE